MGQPYPGKKTVIPWECSAQEEHLASPELGLPDAQGGKEFPGSWGGSGKPDSAREKLPWSNGGPWQEPKAAKIIFSSGDAAFCNFLGWGFEESGPLVAFGVLPVLLEDFVVFSGCFVFLWTLYVEYWALRGARLMTSPACAAAELGFASPSSLPLLSGSGGRRKWRHRAAAQLGCGFSVPGSMCRRKWRYPIAAESRLLGFIPLTELIR